MTKPERVTPTAPCHKHTYKTKPEALTVMDARRKEQRYRCKVKPSHYYYCTVCRGYHLTSSLPQLPNLRRKGVTIDGKR